MFEPPAELDRMVLRQAREAIESERPLRSFPCAALGAPMALAATLVLAVTIMFQAGMPPKQARCPKSPCRTSPSASKCPHAAAPWIDRPVRG